MKKIIDFSTRHPVSVLMYFSLALVLGATSVFCINTRLLPQTKDRWILATANYDGVRAEEIRKLVTIPLEQELSSLKNVKNMESVSRDGSCAIKIELKWGTDIDAAFLECSSILDAAVEALPDDCQRPRAKKLGAASAAFSICVVPKGKDIFYASEFARNEFKSKLLGLEECSSVEISGGQDKEIKVIVDSNKAAFYGLGLDQIARRLDLSNYDYPAGTIQDGQDDIILKTEGTCKSFQEILETPLKTKQGLLRLGDIARVEKSFQKQQDFYLYNGERCVEVKVFCKNNKNPLKLSKKTRALLLETNGRDKNILALLTQDAAQEIWRSLKNLLSSAAAGTAISFFLLLIFFKSAKIAALVASVIPAGVLFTFFSLFCLGKSVNVISLSGVTLCLGMLIDNNIVAVESVLDGVKKGGALEEGISRSIKKIALANSASTFTTIIVFAPVFFIGGIIGEFFCDLGVSVICAMAFSLIFSFSALPAILVLFFKEEIKKARTPAFDFLEKRYQKILERSQNKRFLCPAVTSVCLIFTLLILIPIKKETQPKTRQKNFLVDIRFESGSGVEHLERRAKALSKSVMDLKGVQSVIACGGLKKDRPDRLADAEDVEERIVLAVEARDINKTKAECEKIFKGLNLDYNFGEAQDMISERLCAKDKRLFFGDNPAELYERCQKLFGKSFLPRQKKVLKTFKANKNLLEKAAVTPLALSAALKSSFDGTAAFPYCENGKEISLRVQYEPNEFSSQRNLAALRVPCGAGMIPLSALGHWEEQSGESVLYRMNGKDAKIVSQEAFKKFDGGQSVWLKKRDTAELLKAGMLLLFLALILLYCVLGAQTESFVTPLIYLLAVPPAFLGAALFLAVFRSSLNINSLMAFVALFGTSVNCSIILREGGPQKFSSVMATTATSVASLLPFAVDPLNLNPQSSLALATCGGLTISAAASLILIPNFCKKQTEKNNDSV